MNISGLEVFAATVNDLDDRYPKGRSRCFDIGIWGGCGVDCAAFADGECQEPQEITADEVRAHHGADAELIIAKYKCYSE